MARKKVTDGGKREQIVAAAMDCFLEKGYDGTSVRSIMKKAGGEIGLFYYYFQNKDDAFDKVLDLFFSNYQRNFAEIADSAHRDPFRALTRFFEYMKEETIRFRERYADNIHRTVRWAIRERTLTIVTPYIRQIIGILAELGAKIPLDMDVAAVMLAHGVGSMILHEDSSWMESSTVEVQKAVHLIMGLNLEQAGLMFPEYPDAEDVVSIADLAQEMQEYYPGFERERFLQQISEKIDKKEVLVIRYQDDIGGCIAFSYDRKEIDFLAVRPDCQKRGVAMRLLMTAMAEFPADTELSVVTYREENPIGEAARCLYRKFGFREGELMTAFEYPCQRFTGTAPSNILKARQQMTI
ncbi:GNAT family N-acetyltransferase [Frisingicoccus sp.]|uniref:GNAT family N-acetyltransferase n=1 Tax=Frisingicoccus sp. TaxID=1918627 RepID=UPI002E76663F|nr:GNAT family N-acetyltransferase [Frisingicoccus sp.]MEE0751730.1 GNAT family N-acetyltransferase [Frisingicoccus sp.]